MNWKRRKRRQYSAGPTGQGALSSHVALTLSCRVMSPGSIASGAAGNAHRPDGPAGVWEAASVCAEALEGAQFHRDALGVEGCAMIRIGRRFHPERVLARLAVGEIERQALIERSVLDRRRDEGARSIDIAHSHSDYIRGVEAVRNRLDDLVGLRIALIRDDGSEASPTVVMSFASMPEPLRPSTTAVDILGIFGCGVDRRSDDRGSRSGTRRRCRA